MLCKTNGSGPVDFDGGFYRFKSYDGLEDFKRRVLELHTFEGAEVTTPSRVLLPSGASAKWPEFSGGEAGP